MTDFERATIRALIVSAKARTAVVQLEQRHAVDPPRETIAAGDRVVVTFSVHRWIHADVTERWQWSLDRKREYLETDCGTVYRQDGAMWWLDRTGRARDRATVTSVEKVQHGARVPMIRESHDACDHCFVEYETRCQRCWREPPDFRPAHKSPPKKEDWHPIFKQRGPRCNKPAGDRPCFLDEGHRQECKSLAAMLAESV